MNIYFIIMNIIHVSLNMRIELFLSSLCSRFLHMIFSLSVSSPISTPSANFVMVRYICSGITFINFLIVEPYQAKLVLDHDNVISIFSIILIKVKQYIYINFLYISFHSFFSFLVSILMVAAVDG